MRSLFLLQKVVVLMAAFAVSGQVSKSFEPYFIDIKAVFYVQQTRKTLFLKQGEEVTLTVLREGLFGGKEMDYEVVLK